MYDLAISSKITILAIIIFLTVSLALFPTVNLIKKIYTFYYQGFRQMTIGRSLWLLIIIKIAILFLVLKLFFFPNFLKQESAERQLAPDEVVRNTFIERTIE